MVQYKQEMMFILKTLTISIFMMIIEMFIMEIQIKTEILNFKIMVIMEKILITHQIIFINQCANQELVIQQIINVLRQLQEEQVPNLMQKDQSVIIKILYKEIIDMQMFIELINKQYVLNSQIQKQEQEIILQHNHYDLYEIMDVQECNRHMDLHMELILLL